jgi:hypothetical protein
MPGEGISLREYVDVRFKAQEEAVAAALAAADRAVTKAEVASEKRFDSVNEFRAALNDNNRLLMPRLEAEQSFRVLSDKISDLSTKVAARDDQGRGLAIGWGYLVGAAGLIGMIATMVYELTRSHA